MTIFIAIALLSLFQLKAQDDVTDIRNSFFNPSPNNVLVVAHRGAWHNAPENSIKAVTDALEIGVDIVEIDLQKTKDGHLVLMHDKSIDRTTTGKGQISTLTLDSIRNVFLIDRTGSPTQLKVPTLDELMLTIKGRPLLVNLDKAWENFDLVMKITERTGTTSQVILKGNSPISKLREQYGTLIDRVIYMPMVWPEDYTIYRREKIIAPYQYTKDFIDEFRPKAFEVILKDEVSSVDEALDLIKKENITIWINALWADLCAGHEDSKAINNPDAHWGWIINKGANIIQTDYPRELLEYLRSRKLHK